MNTIFILLIVCSIALGSPSEMSKRKPQEEECECRPHHHEKPPKPEPECKGCCGPDPCNECKEPRIYDKVFTPVKKQEIIQTIKLRCTPGSYFDAIEWQGVWKQNTTCTGVLTSKIHHQNDIYVGLKKGSPPETLNAKNWKYAIFALNGNWAWYETAILKDCRCRGDLLKSNSLWLANDPLTGCCTKGVNLLQATSFRLNIYGKCCSECYLVQAAVSLSKPIKND